MIARQPLAYTHAFFVAFCRCLGVPHQNVYISHLRVRGGKKELGPAILRKLPSHRGCLLERCVGVLQGSRIVGRNPRKGEVQGRSDPQRIPARHPGGRFDNPDRPL